jgi:hypothetical protein
LTDHSNKQISLRCKDGSALIAYTGIGRFRHPRIGAVDIADWIRRFLRARNLGVQESVSRIVDCANTRLAALAHAQGLVHHFCIVAMIQGRMHVAEVSNVIEGALSTRFELRALEVEKDSPRVLLAGMVEAVTQQDRDLMLRLSRRRPARAKDYSKVLADITRRAHSRSSLVSASCTTTFTTVRGEPFSTEVHNDSGELIPSTATMLFSVDLTPMMRSMTESFGLLTKDSMDDQEFSRRQEAAARESVKVEDC